MSAHAAAAPRKRRRQAERSAETKRRLLEATIDCIVERGYARTTTSEIVSRAGLTRGAQLHHFVDRDTLLLAAVDYLFECGMKEFNRAFAARAPEQDGNDAAVDLSWRAFGGRFGMAWLEMLVASRADKQLAHAVRAVATRFNQKLLEFGSSFTSLPVEEFALSQSFEVAVMLGLLVMSIAADKREYAAGRVAVIELLKEFIRALGKDPEMLARVLRKAAPLRPNRDSAR
jgi:AcrR family transcriptional regulator